MRQRLVLVAALIGSLLVHAVTLGGAYLSALSEAHAAEPAPDRWAAASIEVGTVPEQRREATAPPTRAPSLAPEALPAERAPAKPAPRASEAREPDAPSAVERPSERAERARAESAEASAVETPTSAPVASAEQPRASEPAGSLGAVGLPIGVRHFGRAFARALPAANTANPAWSELPLGPVGSVAIEVEIDADGQLGRVEFAAEPPAPAVLRRMVERALLLLRAGTFSLDPTTPQGGVERLTIEVTLSEKAVSVREGYDPAHFHGLGSEPPTRTRPGHGRFTLNSGRHFEAIVRFTEP